MTTRDLVNYILLTGQKGYKDMEDGNRISDKMTLLVKEHIKAEADKMVEKISPTNEQIHAAALAWAKEHSNAPDKDCPTWLIRDYEAGAYFVRQCYGCWNKTDKMVSERLREEYISFANHFHRKKERIRRGECPITPSEIYDEWINLKTKESHD